MKPDPNDVLLRSACGKTKEGRERLTRRMVNSVAASKWIAPGRSIAVAGIPARVDGSALTDLSRSAATDGMLSLNLRNVKRRKDQNTQPRLASKALDPRVNHDIGLP